MKTDHAVVEQCSSPAFHAGDGGANPTSRLQSQTDLDRLGAPLLEVPRGEYPQSARSLRLSPCDVSHARLLIARWHSRLPNTQSGMWQFAFRAAFDGVTYGVALWANPSARMLPSHWLELRRLAVAPDAPDHICSWMLGQMARYFRRVTPERERLVSYQDMAVHTGTIYRAAGWTVARESKPVARDRTTTRPGGRLYRWSINGAEPDVAGKRRWELAL